MSCHQHFFELPSLLPGRDSFEHISVMYDLWVLMKLGANAMARKVSYDAETFTLGNGCNGLTDGIDGGANSGGFDGLHHALIGCLDQSNTERVRLANKHGFTAIAVDTVNEDGDITIDNVTIGKWTVIRDTMTDHLIDGRTNRFRKVMIIEWTGIGAQLNAHLVGDPVEFVASGRRKNSAEHSNSSGG